MFRLILRAWRSIQRNGVWSPPPGLFRLLGGAPGRVVATVRSVLAVRDAFRFAGGLSRAVGGWSVLREVPPSRHEAAALAGAPNGGTVCRRAAGSNYKIR